MMTEIILVTAGIILCIILSAFFSSSEIAFTSCNPMRIENEAEEGSKPARIAHFIIEHFEDALSAILIGNNLVNIASSALASVFVIIVTGGDKYAWAATIIITVLVIIFGETMPKIVTSKSPNRMALRFSYPVRALMFILKPLIMLTVALTQLLTNGMKSDKQDDEEEAALELQSIIETAEDENVIDEGQSELLQNAIEFRDISADEVMTARVDVVAIDIDDDRDEILSVIMNSHYSRIPVYEGSIDNIIGILHLNHFLKAEAADRNADIRRLLMKPCYVYKTVKLPELVKLFRSEQQHLAIVTDEYGGTFGVVTLEDVLEQIVGDIWDETDIVEHDYIKIREDDYIIDGDMQLSDFAELLGRDEESFEAESETLGGWTLENFGGYPKAGDSFIAEGLKITVMSMDGHRVEKVRVRRENS
ncbi:MAG: hemolysin family protein [Lachnospiraceae bacterium]|nr:hemolysin family protein [Lachnospiraceae bacterium]